MCTMILKNFTHTQIINIKAFHTHSNNHKYYKIMHIYACIYPYQHDNQKSTSTIMTIKKAQNNTVNTYSNTKILHTQPPTI